MVNYIGPCGPAVTASPATLTGGEPATELTSSRSNTTNGDATVSAGPKRGLWTRFLELLGLRKPPPPDAGVREPRRPKPSSSGGVATLERPESDGS